MGSEDQKPFEILPLKTQADLNNVRRAVARWALGLQFSILDRTKVITAASEIGRNTIIHGLGGSLRIDRFSEGSKIGFSMIFEDDGPGIESFERALGNGFTTGDGLGLGFGGAKRLTKRFEAHNKPSGGTVVCLTHWK